MGRSSRLTGRSLTVEDLNPRSRAVTSMVSTIKRAGLLIELIEEIGLLVGPDRVADNPPQSLGGRYASKAKRIWGESWRSHIEVRGCWPELVHMVETGSMLRQIRSAMESLPSNIRKKLAEEHPEWDGTSTR